ncbi:MAG: GCN5-related N-acetyltransferase [Pseudomonadota bacterium]
MHMDRKALEHEWLQITRETMPSLATERRWPVRYDHCFQRILLDNAVGGVWYDVISKRPAYAHAPKAVLATAVALGEQVIAGDVSLSELNDHSLRWRRARKNDQASLNFGG